MHRSPLRLSVVIVPMVFATLACSKGDDSLDCSFKNPAVIDTAADKWPKFRRDLQNTGTIILPAESYARVAAGNPNTPSGRSLRWVYPAADQAPDPAFVGSPAINPSSEIVYIGGTNGRILGIRADGDDAGTLVQVSPNDQDRDFLASSAPFSIITTPLVATRDAKDAVFVGSSDARIYGVAADGFFLDQIWPGGIDTAAGSSPTIMLDGTVIVSTLGSGMYGTCPNGVFRYVVTIGASLSTPAVGYRADANNEDEDEFLYVGADDGQLRAIREDGILQWSFALPSPVLAAPIVMLDGAEDPSTTAVFAVDANGVVVRLTRDGRNATGFTGATGIGRVLASPALATHPNGSTRLYVVGLDSGVHALDATTGARIWNWDAGTSIESSPAVVLEQGGDGAPVLVFGTNDGGLVYLQDNGGSGEVIARFEPESGAPITTSPAVGPDGSVYVGSLDGRVYAVR